MPIVLGDAMVIAAFSGTPGRGVYLSSYRLDGLSFVPATPWPQGEELVAWGPGSSPAHLLALTAEDDGSVNVYQTDDLAGAAIPWEHLAHVPASALTDNDRFVSMALLDNDLYLGTRAGSLYALREFELPIQ